MCPRCSSHSLLIKRRRGLEHLWIFLTGKRRYICMSCGNEFRALDRRREPRRQSRGLALPAALPARNPRAGNALIEFTLLGIPLIFVLISTFEMALGMWDYENLAYAIRAGSRYASTHGKGCLNGGNTCGITVGNVASVIAASAAGLPSSSMNVTLSSATAASVTCNPLSSCTSNSATWPPSGDNAPGMDIQIAGTYTFQSAISMLWPGAGKDSFGTFTFVAYTRQPMQF